MVFISVIRFLFILLLQTTFGRGFSTINEPIPITILSGFLGSGKTTLLQHLLQNKEGLRIAVIVNDVASVNIDSKLISGSSSSSSSSTLETSAEGIVELQNGCACCSLSDELLASVSELVTLSDLRGEDKAFNHIVVELSGVADPKGVRAKFQEAILYQMPLMTRVNLDTLTTVIDCSTFLHHLSSNKVANREETPELYFRDGEEREIDLPPGMGDLEALLYGSAAIEADNSVVDLLVGQTETADVILLNKIDLVEDDDKTSDDSPSTVLNKIEQIVKALNPRARVIQTTFGEVPSIKDVLAAAGGMGVVESGVVDDHKDAVQAATQNEEYNQHQQQHSHSHNHDDQCSDPVCTDASHDHSHAHSHDHSHAHSHDHSTSHIDDVNVEPCSDPKCTDPSHSHSHSHSASSNTTTNHAGIGTYVYRARRPFHPSRLLTFLRQMPIVRGLPDEANDGEGGSVDNALPATALTDDARLTFKNVLRSKGFVWLADSNVAALYWSHAGSSFEMQCLGRWWATLPRDQWPEEAISTILADFDDPNHQEGIREIAANVESASFASVGDRRQEIVFIGPSLSNSKSQNMLRDALDECLLTDDEWKIYNENISDENELQSKFINRVETRMVSY